MRPLVRLGRRGLVLGDWLCHGEPPSLQRQFSAYAGNPPAKPRLFTRTGHAPSWSCRADPLRACGEPAASLPGERVQGGEPAPVPAPRPPLAAP
ncbi:hypothetical protein STTU_3701 [Streptomyces sp. Tu6071]|nr:hypothetical protein STTU_3701 [Streptomyces sp. Tu6071]